MRSIERVAAPLKLGGAELMPALLKLGSVFTVASGVHPQCFASQQARAACATSTYGLHGAICSGLPQVWYGCSAGQRGLCCAGSQSFSMKNNICKVERAPCLCAVRNAVLGNLGGQLVRQHLRYEATVQLVVRGAGTLRGRTTLNVRLARIFMVARKHRGARHVAQTTGCVKHSMTMTGPTAATGDREQTVLPAFYTTTDICLHD